MNGYELTQILRKTRRRHRLSAATQALYYELVAICNEEGWPDVFKCSNDELFSALQISEKSLIAYRLELIQAGLIFYLSGKSKKKVCSYSFTREFLNGCKFYNQSDSLSGSQSVSQSVSQSGENSSDSNKTKTKLFVIIEKKDFLIGYLQELFYQDAGLALRWSQLGHAKEKFPAAVEDWTIQNNGKSYHDFEKARKHFLFWLPKFDPDQNLKSNGKSKSITGAKAGKSAGANKLANELRDELSNHG